MVVLKLHRQTCQVFQKAVINGKLRRFGRQVQLVDRKPIKPRTDYKTFKTSELLYSILFD